ncbi:hypothetical protein NW767_015235 [Fusarium falciforme]|nr:hypothetical protein NW767_015235 [Fusarium falciforme]
MEMIIEKMVTKGAANSKHKTDDHRPLALDHFLRPRVRLAYFVRTGPEDVQTRARMIGSIGTKKSHLAVMFAADDERVSEIGTQWVKPWRMGTRVLFS